MMHPTKSRGSVFGGVLPLLALSCAVALFSTHRAEASATYPPKVQEALEKLTGASYCVPQCIVCHLTNQGGFGTLNAFGKNLETKAPLAPLNPNSVVAAFQSYFAKQPDADSDNDGVSDLKELEAGDSPAVPGSAGDSLICPDLRYGCGASVAPAPPPLDKVGLFSAGLVVFGLTLLRRRRR